MRRNIAFSVLTYVRVTGRLGSAKRAGIIIVHSGCPCGSKAGRIGRIERKAMHRISLFVRTSRQDTTVLALNYS